MKWYKRYSDFSGGPKAFKISPLAHLVYTVLCDKVALSGRDGRLPVEFIDDTEYLAKACNISLASEDKIRAVFIRDNAGTVPGQYQYSDVLSGTVTTISALSGAVRECLDMGFFRHVEYENKAYYLFDGFCENNPTFVNPESLRKKEARKNKSLKNHHNLKAEESPGNVPGQSGNVPARIEENRREEIKKEIYSVADATSDIDSKEKAPVQAKIEESLKTTLKAFQNVYNEKVGDTLPQWSKDSQKRNTAVKTWLKSRTLEDWLNLLEKVKTRPFLMGQNDRGWKADALFLLKTENAIKIEEGGYSGKAGVNQQLTTPKPKPKSTAEMLEDSLRNAPTFKPLKERNPELWAKNEKWKAHQEEVERQREEKRREFEKLQLEKLRNYEQEKLANGDLEWEDALAQGEK